MMDILEIIKTNTPIALRDYIQLHSNLAEEFRKSYSKVYQVLATEVPTKKWVLAGKIVTARLEKKKLPEYEPIHVYYFEDDGEELWFEGRPDYFVHVHHIGHTINYFKNFLLNVYFYLHNSTHRDHHLALHLFSDTLFEKMNFKSLKILSLMELLKNASLYELLCNPIVYMFYKKTR